MVLQPTDGGGVFTLAEDKFDRNFEGPGRRHSQRDRLQSVLQLLVAPKSGQILQSHIIGMEDAPNVKISAANLVESHSAQVRSGR